MFTRTFITSTALLLATTISGLAMARPPHAESSGVFVTPTRIAQIRERVEQQMEPQWSAYLQLKDLSDANLNRQPTVQSEWYVPGYYTDAEGHNRAKNGLRDDANIAYGLALMYEMTAERKYADAAIRLIDGWVSGIDSMSTKDDSTLSFSYHFPAFIFAADLLRDEDNLWPKGRQEAFESFLREKALPMNTMDAKNNWGNWGLVLASAIAAYLDDEALLEECAERWKHFIESQIAEDGHLPHEVNRSEGRHGIWYSHFTLMPQTIAAEILKNKGHDLYDYASPSGRTLKLAFDKLVPWVVEPESFHYWKGDPARLVAPRYFSYFEILNRHFPNPLATELLEEDRPLTADHSAPYLTFTHGEPLNQ